MSTHNIGFHDEMTKNYFIYHQIHCPKDLKEHLTIFPYNTMLNTSMLNPHLKAIHNDQECPLLLGPLNNVSKSLTTRHLIHEMSCPSAWNMFLYFF